MSSPGPRLPESVLRRRPAEIVRARRLPAPRPQLGRPPLRVPAQRPLPAPAPQRGRRPVPFGLIAAVLLFVGLFVVSAGVGAATGFDLGDLFRGPDKPPPREFPVLEPSRPQRLIIPAIKVSAPILEVGMAEDQSIAVPPLKRHNEAGWYSAGPTPGQFGPAVIVGHADTRSGPSVFHDLHRLKPGQRIRILRADGDLAVFEVNSVENFGKTKVPAKRVYGDYSRPSLRLMTCGGEWVGGRTGYSDNVVVFASLVGSEKG